MVTMCKNVFAFLMISMHQILVFSQYFRTDVFEKTSCSNSLNNMILLAPAVREFNEYSVITCADSCAKNTDCNFAIFRESTKWCKHVYSYVPTFSTLPDYINEEGCGVFQKNNKPLCQENGVYLDEGKCVCPDMQGHHGGCEDVTEDFCRDSAWRKVTDSDYQTLTDSKFEIKVVIHEDSKAIIYQALTFHLFTTGPFIFEVHNFLVVDPTLETFESPLLRDFKVYTSKHDKLITYNFDMSGSDESNHFKTPVNFSLWMREALDPDQTFYFDSPGSDSSLTDELSKGYRLTEREDTRVELTNDNIFFERPMGNVGVGENGFNTPLYFFSTKHTVLKSLFITRTRIKDGSHVSIAQNPNNLKNLELDRCWTKVNFNEVSEYSESLLREIVLNGHEVRLLLGSTTSTDITMVTGTNRDVVAVLAYYLTPFDAVNELNANSRIRFPLISQSKRIAECEMQFQGSTVYGVTNEMYTSSIEWVVSARMWTKIFKLHIRGDVLFGSRLAVYDAAMGKKNIRVCAEMSDYIFHCHGKMTVYELEDSHLLFQTPAVLRPDFNEEGTFSGIQDQDCRRHVWLFSTKGKMERASYIIGQADGPDAVVSESFVTITWYSDG